MNKERKETSEVLTSNILLTLQHCPNIEDEELLNKIIFGFNQLEPNAIKATTEIRTADNSYCLSVTVDNKHLIAFKQYIKNKYPSIIF